MASLAKNILPTPFNCKLSSGPRFLTAGGTERNKTAAVLGGIKRTVQTLLNI